MSSDLNKSLTLFVIVPWLVSTGVARAQGFVNLDFEHPNTPLTPVNFRVPITNALPGWAGYYNGASVNLVLYDTLSAGAAAISFHDSSSPVQPIQGQYLVVLQGSSAGGPESAAIAQTGQVPIGTASLVFWGGFSGQLTFNGQPLSYVGIGAGPNYTIYGADFSGLGSQVGELRFTAPANNNAILDNIQFSNQPLPEPSAALLVGVGALLLRVARNWCRS